MVSQKIIIDFQIASGKYKFEIINLFNQYNNQYNKYYKNV